MLIKTAIAEELEPWRQLVRLEYRDVPTMRLTLTQACRLWSLDTELCRRVLDSLVESHDLAAVGGQYCRADCMDGTWSID
jgi:hypothetical protein